MSGCHPFFSLQKQAVAERKWSSGSTAMCRAGQCLPQMQSDRKTSIRTGSCVAHTPTPVPGFSASYPLLSVSPECLRLPLKCWDHRSEPPCSPCVVLGSRPRASYWARRALSPWSYAPGLVCTSQPSLRCSAAMERGRTPISLSRLHSAPH